MALRKVIRTGAGTGGGPAGPCGFNKDVYVDAVRGNDATGVRGDFDKCFQTIQAALNAALSYDRIVVGPGIYNAKIVMPDLDGIAIVGASRVDTILLGDGVNPLFQWVPGPNAFVRSFYTGQLQIMGATQKAIDIDGVNLASPRNFCDHGMFFEEVDVAQGDVWLKCISTVRLNRCTWLGQAQVQNCSVFATQETEIAQKTLLQYIGANPHPDTGRSLYALANNTIVGELHIVGHPIVEIDPTSLVLGYLDATGLTSALPLAPIIAIQGAVGNPFGAPVNTTFIAQLGTVIELSRGLFFGPVAITYGPTGPALPVRGRQSFFASTITLNGAIALDIRDSSYNPLGLGGAGPFTVDQSSIVFLGVPDGGPGVLFPITIAPPLPTANYVVTVTPLPPPGGVPCSTAVTAKVPAGCVVLTTSPAPGYTYDVRVERGQL